MSWLKPSRLWRVCIIYIVFITLTYVWIQQVGEGIGFKLPSNDVQISDNDRMTHLINQRKARYYSYQQSEANRTGPGEHGAEVKLSKEEVALIESEMKREGFSKYVNSLVSLDRSLMDYRDDACKKQDYPYDLPTASVIIIFRNELQRVVLRTVHSVINRTPPQYLKEVILVDDASEREELKKPLDDHLLRRWPHGIVQVIRLRTRSGLIRTRLAGVAAATGDVVVIMDGHMEVTKGWAEPLLARIKENNRILVTPLIDMVHPNDMKYMLSGVVYQSFSWNMEYVWRSLPKGVTHNPIEPLPTYALVGCIMAMHRATFLEMGSFDTGMDVWGGENVELPIRVWMCGGRVEIIVCSRVAHTYRAGWGRPWNSSDNSYFQRNIQRIAEVWLDDYKDQFYLVHQNLVKNASTVRASVRERLELRKRLGCKSFQWLIDNVVRPPMFIYTRNTTYWGQLKNVGTNKCMDSLNTNRGEDGALGVYSCHPRNSLGYTQLFTLTRSHQLRTELHCVASNHRTPGKNATFYHECEDVPSQRWTYDTERRHIVHALSSMCLEARPSKDLISYVELNTCTDTLNQQWIWITYNISELLKP